MIGSYSSVRPHYHFLMQWISTIPIPNQDQDQNQLQNQDPLYIRVYVPRYSDIFVLNPVDSMNQVVCDPEHALYGWDTVQQLYKACVRRYQEWHSTEECIPSLAMTCHWCHLNSNANRPIRIGQYGRYALNSHILENETETRLDQIVDPVPLSTFTDILILIHRDLELELEQSC